MNFDLDRGTERMLDTTPVKREITRLVGKGSTEQALQCATAAAEKQITRPKH